MLVLLGAPRAGIWVLMDLALLAIPYAIAGNWLRDAGYAVLGIAYLIPLLIGWPGAALAWIAGARAGRRRGFGP